METYDIYKKKGISVAGFDASDRDMTKISDRCDREVRFSNDTISRRSIQPDLLLCRYYRFPEKERDQVLLQNVENDPFTGTCDRAITDGGVICAIGGEDKIEQNQAEFKEVKDL